MSNRQSGANGEETIGHKDEMAFRETSQRLLVLSAPSGAGKTTIARRLLERHPEWRFSVSATTRPRRVGEVEGRDYYFLSVDEFHRRIEHDDLVEWESLFGNFYGTLRSEITRLLDAQHAVRIVFDVDVKGALAIRRAFPHEAFLVFIAPPSFDELERRLRARRTDSDETIRTRIERAVMEMQMRTEFDAVVINDTVERAVEEIEAMLAEGREQKF